jgi:hypothetical protein
LPTSSGHNTINAGKIKRTLIDHVLLLFDVFGVHNDQIIDANIIK